ncbi:uncharacterized protein K02A2.6-like [Amphibalanus amphitrite]|uniref:uncharacterized protein K02A2.6-like n=1 Tax=Amphibalanus amphitrite TaxID=1232801 RepID=UPI001C920878|nr:uncharacterized protein K02A2.6-like [Amphibalanus amphitrite]
MDPTGMQLVSAGPYRAGTDFEKWLRALERYMVAMDIQGPTRRCAVLLHLVGPDIADVSDSLPEEEAEGPEEDEFTRLKRKLVRYLVPRNNVVAERGKFQGMTMEPEESLEEFLARLRAQILRCGYEPAQVNRELRDRCVLGSRGELQRKLVREAALKGDDLNLEDVRRTARAHRDVMDLTTRLSGAPAPAETDGEAVHLVRRPQRTERRDCGKQRTGVKLVQDGDQADWQVSAVQPAAAEWATVRVNGQEFTMLIDTGSPVTIISAETHIPGLTLRPSELHLTSFTGQQIRLRGEADVNVETDGRATRLRLVVSDMGSHRPLMGREWIKALRTASGLETLNVCPVAPQPTLKEVMDKHREVFKEELGRIPVKVALRLKEGAKPVYRRARPVPFALQQDIERELDKWLDQGIAEKVPPGHFSGWGTPLVPIPKKDGVRLCADYRITVNPQLQPLKYPMRTPEELFASIRGKKFCKLDCRNAYLQCELDEESREMTTVTTHRGAMRMNRLPYGISTCGAQFQAIMDQVLDGLPGVVCYLDDVLIGADSDRELMDRLDRVLERLKDNGVRLKKEKCQFGVREVVYLGWRLSEAGLRPVQEKTAAVIAAPDPRNVQELRSLIGSVSYYQRLLPNLSTVLAPLYALLKTGVKWAWTAECAAAVRRVKDMLSTAPVLMRYDPVLPLRLVTDASATGVGAALMQVTPEGLERPVQYASRTLTPTERKYAQVEREAAAVSFGVRRFHQFLFGRPFTLVVDNRTLSRILNPDRELPSLAAARMQRYALQLAAYQYKIELRRTEDMRLADTMSRLSVPDEAENRLSAEEEAAYGGGGVMFIAEQGPCLTAQQIAVATRRDPVLARALAAVRSGWPTVVDPDLAPFKNRREELTTEADCLLWGGRVVIPSNLRDTVKRELHEGHFGCTRMKQLARRFVWWPGLDAELEALARGCQACVSKRAEPPQATRHPWEPTDGPWQRVHSDFAGPMLGHSFLIMVDSYTKWIEAVPMKTTAARTVAVMRDIFARLGLPVQLVTDNGPQFASQEFAAFVRSNGIRHTRVAPHHPSSNGLAERAVGTVKNALRVCAAAGGGVDLSLSRALLAYRVTPHAATGRTPAEMLFGRNLRTRMNLMVPSAETALQAARDRQRETAGGRSREFAVGATVWARSYDGRQKWVRGTVVARPGPVSYEVDVGHVIWSRHVDQLLAAAADPGNNAGG